MSLLRPVLDLTLSAWTKNYGDLQVFGTWWLDTDGEAPWPCLVIVPAHKSMSFSYVPYVVSMDLAWKWSEEAGDDPAWCMEEGIRACDGLGLAVNFKNCTRILSIIRGHLGDLLAIPPRPKELTKIVADAIVTNADGTQQHREIADAM